MGRNADKIEEFLGEPPIDFLITSGGVGMSGTILEWIKNQGWAGSVGDEVLQAVVAAAIMKWGDKAHEKLPLFGKGMMYHLAGRIISERVGPMIPVVGRAKGAYPANAAAQAFQQKHGRQPTANEQAIMARAYASRAPIAQQQVQQQQAPIQMPVDLHYMTP